ncbi:MAG TPA: ribbon-helix-helix protein, CopG family [Thermoanaerobaculia bacterium]|nr:ribbon-helix-helix protein, CopG family [Thermoanaerobaculia bacterium]
MRTVSLKIPDELNTKLAAAAHRRGWTKSELVRRAVAKFLPAAEPGEDGFLERAGELIGCVDGPPDLSTNPRHLRGYGK